MDATRTVPGAADAILRTLESLGLVWDGEVAWQSQRKPLYAAALDRLRSSEHVYRCRCSRREIADSGLRGTEGAIYPGTCEALDLPPTIAGAERMRAGGKTIAFDDRVQGRIEQDVAGEVGDFVLERRDGLHAYQLAVVVDDAEQGITDVVRGADLLWSTPRQILLQRALLLPTPRYMHVPAATNARGEKLSKQTHAAAVQEGDAGALLAALEFLGQKRPGGESKAQMLRAAAAHWNPGLIARGAARTQP